MDGPFFIFTKKTNDMIIIDSQETKTYFFPMDVESSAEAFVLEMYSDLSKHKHTFDVNIDTLVSSKNHYAIVIDASIIESLSKGEYNYCLKDESNVVSKGLIRIVKDTEGEYEPGEDYVVYGEDETWLTTKDESEAYNDGYADGVGQAEATIRDLNDLIEDQQDTIRELQSDLDYKNEIISEQEDQIYSVEYTTFTENGVYETNYDDDGVLGWNKVTVNVPTYDEGYEACYDEYSLDEIDYLSFTSTQDGSAIAMTNYNNRNARIYYSYDKQNWTEWDLSEIQLDNNQTVYMMGEIGTGSTSYCNFVMTGSINAGGNCLTLLSKTGNYIGMSMAYCFYKLFNNCTALKTPPSLPSTRVGFYSYHSMFANSGIEYAPELPARQLSVGSYREMFINCKDMEKAPTILPATQVQGQGYYCMFIGCIKLTESPIICATSISDLVLGRMFWDCTNLELLTTYIASYTDESIVYGNNKAGQWRNIGNCDTEGSNIVPDTWTILTLQ